MDFLNEQLQIANVYLLNLCDGCSQSAERFHQPTGDRSGGRFRRRCCGMPCLRLSTGKLLLAAQSSNYRYSSHLTRTVSLTGSVRLDFLELNIDLTVDSCQFWISVILLNTWVFSIPCSCIKIEVWKKLKFKKLKCVVSRV